MGKLEGPVLVNISTDQMGILLMSNAELLLGWFHCALKAE